MVHQNKKCDIFFNTFSFVFTFFFLIFVVLVCLWTVLVFVSACVVCLAKPVKDYCKTNNFTNLGQDRLAQNTDDQNLCFYWSHFTDES